MHKPLIISVVGAGGKTTHIHRLAEKYLKQGKKVLVITTTHMYLEKDTILELENDMETSVGRMKDALAQGFCMAGSPCEEERKMGPLSDHVTEQILPAADVVLVEADGAKHRLIKYPDSTEPVIYPGSSEIHIVMGMAAAGKKCRDVAHRTEKVMQCLGDPGRRYPDTCAIWISGTIIQPLSGCGDPLCSWGMRKSLAACHGRMYPGECGFLHCPPGMVLHPPASVYLRLRPCSRKSGCDGAVPGFSGHCDG